MALKVADGTKRYSSKLQKKGNQICYILNIASLVEDKIENEVRLDPCLFGRRRRIGQILTMEEGGTGSKTEITHIKTREVYFFPFFLDT